MHTTTPEKSGSFPRMPRVYRELAAADWISALPTACRWLFGDDLKIFNDVASHRVQLLSPDEIFSFRTEGRGAVEELIITLENRAPKSEYDVGFRRYRITDRGKNGSKSVLMDVRPNELLLAEREDIRDVVDEVTGIDIKPAEDFNYCALLGEIPRDSDLSKADARRGLYETYKPDVVGLEAQMVDHRVRT